MAKEKGIGYKRVESLNADPLFIEAMGDLMAEHLRSGEKVSKQMRLRCPSCENAKCPATKRFFSEQ